MPGFLKNLLPSFPILYYCLLSLGNFRQRLYVRKFLAGSTQFTQTTSAESFNMGSLGILVVDTNNLRAHTPRGRVESRPPPRGRPNIRAFFPLRALLLVLLVGVLHRGVGLSSAQLAQRRVDCAREVFVFSRFERSWAHVGGFPFFDAGMPSRFSDVRCFASFVCSDSKSRNPGSKFAVATSPPRGNNQSLAALFLLYASFTIPALSR